MVLISKTSYDTAPNIIMAKKKITTMKKNRSSVTKQVAIKKHSHRLADAARANDQSVVMDSMHKAFRRMSTAVPSNKMEKMDATA